MCPQLLPRKANQPPVVFHWLPFIGSAVGYGTDPLNFFNRCRDKVGVSSLSEVTLSLTSVDSTAMCSPSFSSVDA